MDNQPSFDRSILIPIFISGCSVIGILAVLLIGRALNAPAEVAVTPSATRFPYVYLGTEPVDTTPLVEDTEIGPTEPPIEEPGDIATPSLTTPTVPTVFSTPTRPGANTPIVLTLPITTNTSTPTDTSASGPPLNPGTYDDVFPNLLYLPQNGWRATGTGGSTLHVSDLPGSTVSFRFIGTQVRLLYQGGITLGQVRIVIDTNPPVNLDQSSGSEWVSDLLANSTHSVTITHVGGGSVNLDQIIIPAPANTPTPTATPTRTQRP